jgi:quercetin dioxygenase-like cupin family protein
MWFSMLLVLTLFSHGSQTEGQQAEQVGSQAAVKESSHWIATEIPNLEMSALSRKAAPEDLVVTRIRARRKVCMPFHSYPVDEQLTVMKGSVALRTQDHPDRKSRLQAGESVVLKSGVSHSATFAAGTEVELRGKGRLLTTWVDPAAVKALKQNPVDSNSERSKMKSEQDKR